MSTSSSSPLLSTTSRYVGSIDQGTSSTRFILFDHTGTIVRQAQRELTQIHTEGKAGWAEHSPKEIVESVLWCVEEVMKSTQLPPSAIVSIGLTNQRETTVAWDRITGEPLHNAIVWHDTRTQQIVQQMSSQYAELGSNHFRSSTGLPISTYFSALKMRWLIENVPAVQQAIKEERCLMGTVDSWVIWNLSGGAKGNKAGEKSTAVHITDCTNASRTMLMDLKERKWSKENCELVEAEKDEEMRAFGIPLSVLPQIRSNSEIYSHISSHICPLLSGVPLAGCIGDQQSAMLGQLCLKDGDAKNTYGTGCFMLLNTGPTPVASEHGLLTTVCFQLGENANVVYALEGSVAVAGSGVRWLRDEMKLIKSASEINTLASTVPDSNDVYFVPAFSGLLSPYWRDDARGIIAGLTHSSSSAHLARAVLDSAAYQTREVLDAMQSDAGSRISLTSLRVDGGMCASDLLMQFQSDLLNIPVVRPSSLEATATGAAFCAGLAVGYWKDIDELAKIMHSKPDATRTFSPKMQEEKRAQLYKGWKKAVQRTMGWIEKPAGSTRGIHTQAIGASSSSSSSSSHRTTPLPASSCSSCTCSSSTSSPTILRSLSRARRFSPVLSHLATLGVGLTIGAFGYSMYNKKWTPNSILPHKL